MLQEYQRKVKISGAKIKVEGNHRETCLIFPMLFPLQHLTIYKMWPVVWEADQSFHQHHGTWNKEKNKRKIVFTSENQTTVMMVPICFHETVSGHGPRRGTRQNLVALSWRLRAKSPRRPTWLGFADLNTKEERTVEREAKTSGGALQCRQQWGIFSPGSDTTLVLPNIS